MPTIQEAQRTIQACHGYIGNHVHADEIVQALKDYFTHLRSNTNDEVVWKPPYKCFTAIKLKEYECRGGKIPSAAGPVQAANIPIPASREDVLSKIDEHGKALRNYTRDEYFGRPVPWVLPFQGIMTAMSRRCESLDSAIVTIATAIPISDSETLKKLLTSTKDLMCEQEKDRDAWRIREDPNVIVGNLLLKAGYGLSGPVADVNWMNLFRDGWEGHVKGFDKSRQSLEYREYILFALMDLFLLSDGRGIFCVRP
ncbi:hypothetical protein CC80DRAFT_570348 [Byssothecium circinans]|uniref:Uncharacterized protein n=1 Tax=Byssothecium circinans TaxID=147558 RepID=A0A6A5UBB1_9PLEO|nr:hypothetical protein CC80DRAFT_570348 [Byssothecium circinans]